VGAVQEEGALGSPLSGKVMGALPTLRQRFREALPGDEREVLAPRAIHGAAWASVRPTPVARPRMVAVATALAAELGGLPWAAPDFLAAMAGNTLLPGSRPYAACYGGHQFGSWAGQLGDGRAIVLGEMETSLGLQELQLKGAGPTPFARRADGRAVLRSSVREFLCSEAMHYLGIPTTRALTLVATGESVVRDPLYDGHPRPEPGAVVCRVAPSFLRFGTFELPASRGDVSLLTRLSDYAIALVDGRWPVVPSTEARRSAWFVAVCERTAVLMAHWMRVGFVHGVMNTDNLSVLGLTLDYGPYGWLEPFDPTWTPNTTDAAGRRYAYGRQPQVAGWNLMRLAEALSLVVPDTAALEEGLRAYGRRFAAEEAKHTAQKLGLGALRAEDDALVADLYGMMRRDQADFTLFFRWLSEVDPAAPPADAVGELCYAPLSTEAERAWQAWLGRWRQRFLDEADPQGRQARMLACNPRFVLRNYLVQEAIERAEAGDDAGVKALYEVLQRPYAAQPGREGFFAKRPAWARARFGCDMLSCSS